MINANQANGFWHTDLNDQKQSLLDKGDTVTYDISTIDNGLTLFQALKAQIAANPAQVLNLPIFWDSKDNGPTVRPRRVT